MHDGLPSTLCVGESLTPLPQKSLKRLALLTDDLQLAEQWAQTCLQHGLTCHQAPPQSDPQELLDRGYSQVLRPQDELEAHLPPPRNLNYFQFQEWLMPTGALSEEQRQTWLLWAIQSLARKQAPGFLEQDPRAVGCWLELERITHHIQRNAEFYQNWWQLIQPLHQTLGLYPISDPPRQAPAKTSPWLPLANQWGFFARFPQLRRPIPQDLQQAWQILEQGYQEGLQKGLCTPAQVQHWRQRFPTFPERYWNLRPRPGLDAAAVRQRILSPRAGLDTVENHLDVVTAILCDASYGRFLLERKVNHPIAMCEARLTLPGGYRLHSQETGPQAWRREAGEEWIDPESNQVAALLADRARPWRRFSLLGAEFPGPFGMEVLLVELPDQEFTRLTEIVTKNNNFANRPEGWPEVRLRQQIPHDPLMGGHEEVLLSFLEQYPERPSSP